MEFLTSIEESAFAVAISESEFIFPVIETVHVLALALVFGSIAMLDLRMLGVSQRDKGVKELAEEMLPWTWGAFVIAAMSGLLMYVSGAAHYAENGPFLVKLGLLALAGVNMAYFHLTAYCTVDEWNHMLPTPSGAKIAGGLSLFIWTAVIFAGRWIGFV